MLAIIFDTALGSDNIDIIKDFSVDDKIQLSDVIFSDVNVVSTDNFVIGSTATSSNHRIIYDKVNGDLYYDADGTGSIDAIKFATLSDNSELSHNSFIV